MNRARYLIIAFFLTFVATQSSLAQDKPKDAFGNDGFVEKTYVVFPDALDRALDSIFVKSVPAGTTILKQNIIQRHGVGDTNGKWGTWNGIGTIEGLQVKDGGVTVAVKRFTDRNGITVGFKVDDGDKASSETLQEILEETLVAIVLKQKREKVSSSQPLNASDWQKRSDNIFR